MQTNVIPNTLIRLTLIALTLFGLSSCGSSDSTPSQVSMPTNQAGSDHAVPLAKLSEQEQKALDEAEHLLTRRAPKDAIDVLSDLVEAHPRDLQLNAFVAHAEWLDGQYLRARKRAGWVRTALEPFVYKNRDNVLARDVLSRARMVLGDLTGAEVQLRIAIRRGRSTPDVVQRWVELLLKRGNLSDQFALFEKTLSKERALQEPSLCPSRCLALIEVNRLKQAQEEAEACFGAAQSAFDKAQARTVQAVVAIRRGDLDQAEQWAQQAIDFSPDSSESYHVLGLVHWRKGASEKAVEALEAALKIRQDPEYSYLLGVIHAHENRLKEAISSLTDSMFHLEIWSQKQADRWRVPFLLGRVYARKKLYARAQQVLEKAIQLEPEPTAHREIYRHLVWVRQKGSGTSR